ncbi:MAG TPA: ABC transporter permease [Conexibacter sp.]|nr:ABC transporter permease [Conexibacter sp.]
MKRRIGIESRGLATRTVQLEILFVSVLGALLVGAVLIGASGHDPLQVYRSILDSGFGSSLAFSQTLVSTAPLVLTAAATVAVFRSRIYSIGMDGQLIAGAIAASGVALKLGDGAPAGVAVPLVLLAGVAGGMAWVLVPALARAYLGTNEVLSTLMMNFIAFQLMAYLVVGVASIWRDKTQPGLAQAATIPANAFMPHFFAQADVGILIAVGAALLTAAYLAYSRRGFELRVIGDSVQSARYAGMNIARNVVFAFLLSGALCGLAGAIQVTSVTQSLDPGGVNPGLGLGFTGIVIAALARWSIVASIPVALLMAALLNAGFTLQSIGIPSALVVVLQGTVLLLVVGGQFLLNYRIRFYARARERTPEREAVAAS